MNEVELLVDNKLEAMKAEIRKKEAKQLRACAVANVSLSNVDQAINSISASLEGRSNRDWDANHDLVMMVESVCSAKVPLEIKLNQEEKKLRNAVQPIFEANESELKNLMSRDSELKTTNYESLLTQALNELITEAVTAVRVADVLRPTHEVGQFQSHGPLKHSPDHRIQ